MTSPAAAPARGWKDAKPSRTMSAEERFWLYVQKTESCWLFIGGGKPVTAYGNLVVDGRRVRAHRFSYELATGTKIPPDMLVCHTCDTPSCVNPAHLYAGSALTNRSDALSRGRAVNSAALLQSAKTHCPVGHPYDDVNTIRRSDGRRVCRECKRARSSQAYAARVERNHRTRAEAAA